MCPNSPASEEEEKEEELDVLAREFSESVAIQQTFVGGQLHAKIDVADYDLLDLPDGDDMGGI